MLSDLDVFIFLDSQNFFLDRALCPFLDSQNYRSLIYDVAKKDLQSMIWWLEYFNTVSQKVNT
jgi:hypothetical protein